MRRYNFFPIPIRIFPGLDLLLGLRAGVRGEQLARLAEAERRQWQWQRQRGRRRQQPRLVRRALGLGGLVLVRAADDDAGVAADAAGRRGRRKDPLNHLR